MTRIAVTGGRDYSDARRVYQILDAAVVKLNLTTLMVGDCPTGLDNFALSWARSRGVDFELYCADWKKYGKAAGPIRNGGIVAMKPEIVMAFPGNAGTADMIHQSNRAGIRVIEVDR